MATYIFNKVAREASEAGYTAGEEDARSWLRRTSGRINTVNMQRELTNRENAYSRLTRTDIGRLYMFKYDPKWKDKLPYYDMFPLVFIMDVFPGGFLGMNMHYLPVKLRARLMDALYQIERNDAVRGGKKLRLRYALMNSVASFKWFRPTVKRYLVNRVRSRFLFVPYEHWDIAMFLPTARFRKAKQQQVWRDSRNKII